MSMFHKNELLCGVGDRGPETAGKKHHPGDSADCLKNTHVSTFIYSGETF